MTDERPDEQLPEHERRPETSIGGGVTTAGGTASETGRDRPPTQADPEASIEDPPTPYLDEDEEPEDPDGPDVAYQPKSV